jgi:hypothetical protein
MSPEQAVAYLATYIDLTCPPAHPARAAIDTVVGALEARLDVVRELEAQLARERLGAEADRS